MGFLARASALFAGLKQPPSYHQALQISGDAESQLMAARSDLRNAIRAAGSRIRIEDRYWDSSFLAKTFASRPDVCPRFFTQGSYAYKLLIDPCHCPPQQVDLDDGLYVVVDYLQNGQPALVAKALFEMVEEAVAPLCKARGWTLDSTKESCVRVQLSPRSHIDIPIYSAPRAIAESKELNDLAFASGRVAKSAGHTYAKLPSDKIMLACRDGTWQQSDPLKLQEWVEACVQRHGEDFRRACRYFKGWRDYQWTSCCLSSITVMAAVQLALEQLFSAHKSFEDDRLVYEIAQLLPGIFEHEIYNPVFPSQRIVLNDWSDEQRDEIVAASRALAENMERALKRSADATLVVEALRRTFGDRVPYRPDAVEILPPATATVATAKAAVVPAPRIMRSTSG